MDKSLDKERPAKQTKGEAAQDTSRRHRLWLTRGRQGAGKKFASWRPQARYRVSAKICCRALDNQIRVGMGKSGLKLFQKRSGEDAPEWKDEARWTFVAESM